MAVRYREYLESAEWDRLRRHVFARDGERCLLCNSRRHLEGHHRVYPRYFEDDRPQNVSTLCASCHRAHHRRQMPTLLLRWAVRAALVVLAGAAIAIWQLRG